MNKSKRIVVDANAPGDNTQTTRRSFVKNASQVAATAPAVGILLSAKPAAAIVPYCAGACSHFHILDDFTFGNNEEDLDSAFFGSNFNVVNGTNNQDDVFIP